MFEGLSWDALHEHFDAITASGYSVSVFTRWGETVDQVWIKSRVTDAPEQERDELFGAVAATVDRHPILGLDPVNCTPQLGVPGPWSDRLPHFRMGFTPSNGEEIQSEYHVRARPRRGRRSAPSTRWARRCAPSAAGLRDPHHRRRRAVDEPAVPPAERRPALHVDARARGRRARAASSSRPRWPRSARGRTGARPSARRRPRSRRSTSACPTSRASRGAWTRGAPFATTGSSATSSGTAT